MNQVDLLENVIYNIFYLSVSSLWRTCIMKYFVTAMCANCHMLCNENSMFQNSVMFDTVQSKGYYNGTSNRFGLTKSKLKTVYLHWNSKYWICPKIKLLLQMFLGNEIKQYGKFEPLMLTTSYPSERLSHQKKILIQHFLCNNIQI